MGRKMPTFRLRLQLKRRRACNPLPRILGSELNIFSAGWTVYSFSISRLPYSKNVILCVSMHMTNQLSKEEEADEKKNLDLLLLWWWRSLYDIADLIVEVEKPKTFFSSLKCKEFIQIIMKDYWFVTFSCSECIFTWVTNCVRVLVKESIVLESSLFHSHLFFSYASTLEVIKLPSLG